MQATLHNYQFYHCLHHKGHFVLIECIYQLLVLEPEKRLTACLALSHPWLTGAGDQHDHDHQDDQDHTDDHDHNYKNHHGHDDKDDGG